MKEVFKSFMIVIVLLTVGSSSAFAITLPDPTQLLPNLGVPPASAHNDFYSYSLPILAIEYDLVNGGGTGPSNPFYVASGIGQIKNDVVIFTGATGVPVNTNFAGMDDAYPSPNSSGISTFSTGTTADPNGASEFIGDTADTWDATLSSMLAYLDGSPLVFFWNNNQEKSNDKTGLPASAEDLFGWGKIAIVDSDGVLPTKYFDFSDDTDSIYDPFVSRANPGDYVFSPGNVIIPGYEIDHNLGANQAAYALYSAELSDGLSGWYNQGYDAMQLDIRLAELNNGFEQLFIQRINTSTTVPEPTSLFLLFSGILGLFLKKKVS